MTELRRSTRVAALLGILLAGIASSTPRAAAMSLPAPVAFELSQQTFDRAGNPWLSANPANDGTVLPSWAICPPGEAVCRPATTGVEGQRFGPGPTAAGTVFQASGVVGGVMRVGRSTPWQGTVTSTAPPTLTGTPKVGRRVAAQPGGWSGGWGDDFDLLSIAACRTPSGSGCVTIAHPWGPKGDDALVLDARWSGRWLFAYDQRFAARTVFPAIGYRSAGAISVPALGAAVARSAPLGPVAGPSVAIRQRARVLRDGRLLVARVACAARCDVGITVFDGQTRSHARMRASGLQGLAVPGGRLDGTRMLRVLVRVGATPVVEGAALPVCDVAGAIACDDVMHWRPY